MALWGAENRAVPLVCGVHYRGRCMEVALWQGGGWCAKASTGCKRCVVVPPNSLGSRCPLLLERAYTLHDTCAHIPTSMQHLPQPNRRRNSNTG